MVEEVRRQFRENAGILQGKVEPDYARCVAIATRGALREMIVPGLLAVGLPIAVGLIPGLGKLVLVHRKARQGRNPATGEPVHVPAKKVLKFRIAKAAKDAVM